MAKAKKSKKKSRKPAKRKAPKRASARASASRKTSRGKAKKSKAKKAAPKKAKSASRKSAVPAKAKRPVKAAKKAAPKKKNRIVGEGDYQASRNFLKDQGGFVRRHNSEIPRMGKDAEAAMDGPQGGELRAAEEEARSHSKAPGSEA